MRLRTLVLAATSLLVLIGAAFAVESKPRPFRQYPGREYEDFPLPPDYAEKTEWVFARLMYPPSPYGRGGRRFGGFRGSDWREGVTSWTTDYPRAERHLAMALRRLSRVH